MDIKKPQQNKTNGHCSQDSTYIRTIQSYHICRGGRHVVAISKCWNNAME